MNIRYYVARHEWLHFNQRNKARKSVVPVILTNKEFELLDYFLRNKGTAIKRDEIIDGVWGEDYIGSARGVDDTLRRIRKKVTHIPIENVYGYGYIMRDMKVDEEKVVHLNLGGVLADCPREYFR